MGVAGEVAECEKRGPACLVLVKVQGVGLRPKGVAVAVIEHRLRGLARWVLVGISSKGVFCQEVWLHGH